MMLDIVNKSGGSIWELKKASVSLTKKVFAVYLRFRAINLLKSVGNEQLIAASDKNFIRDI